MKNKENGGEDVCLINNQIIDYVVFYGCGKSNSTFYPA
jgi:hypothetical protein